MEKRSIRKTFEIEKNKITDDVKSESVENHSWETVCVQYTDNDLQVSQSLLYISSLKEWWSDAAHNEVKDVVIARKKMVSSQTLHEDVFMYS